MRLVAALPLLVLAALPDAAAAVTLAGGEAFWCVIRIDGDVTCFGRGADGRTGHGDVLDRGGLGAPLGGDALPAISLGALAPAETWVDLSATHRHACALSSAGRVKAWGANDAGGGGYLGYEDAVARGGSNVTMGDALPFVDLGANATAQSVRCGERFSCALLAAGAGVKCFGLADDGRLGYGDVLARGQLAGTMGDALPALPFGLAGRGASRVLELALGSQHACAAMDGGVASRVLCWGSNARGELGYGDTASRGATALTGVDVLAELALGAGGALVLDGFSLGAAVTCALHAPNGSAVCWGASPAHGGGVAGDLGDAPGELRAELRAVELGAGRNVSAVRCGGSSCCALFTGADAGKLKCW